MSFIKGIRSLSIVLDSTLANNTKIKRFCKLRNVKIGNYSYVANGAQLIHTTIGQFCSIGPGVMSGLGKHPSTFVSSSPVFYSEKTFLGVKARFKQKFEEYEPVTIGHDCWIGARAILMDGIKVGNGAIIGAGAVVTKDVPPYAIVGGVPAKIIKYRFGSELQDKLEQSKWWQEKIDHLLEINHLIDNPHVFLHELHTLKTKR
ncbi:CatB-related O-acetyltransferase [Bacillus sp. JCM 19041]|uniref:CatB-related O-acetyltransferase n=1 Tax=Bacillus sp. JCM 19041 TaxID=1460637 RepID=UPI0006D0BCA8